MGVEVLFEVNFVSTLSFSCVEMQMIAPEKGYGTDIL
jgi:hypothetical protein